MKRIDWKKHVDRMRSVIETKYNTTAVVWAGENKFVVVKDGKEIWVKYE